MEGNEGLLDLLRQLKIKREMKKVTKNNWALVVGGTLPELPRLQNEADQEAANAVKRARYHRNKLKK